MINVIALEHSKKDHTGTLQSVLCAFTEDHKEEKNIFVHDLHMHGHAQKWNQKELHSYHGGHEV